MAASRALLGVHWLTDVVAGLVVGWGWFLLSALAFGGRFQRLGDPARARRRPDRKHYSADSATTVSTRLAIVVGLGPLEHHAGLAAAELDQAHVVGEERAVLDLPS